MSIKEFEDILDSQKIDSKEDDWFYHYLKNNWNLFLLGRPDMSLTLSFSIKEQFHFLEKNMPDASSKKPVINPQNKKKKKKKKK